MKQIIVPALARLSLALAFTSLSLSVRANVYPTNIKVNGAQRSSVAVGQGSPVTISYILNEAASAGITITVLSGSTTVRTISIPSGSGTVKGPNSVVWDGKDAGGLNVPTGSYSVRIAAAATGYSDWTQISDDAAPSSYCNRPRGLAVNNNPTSPYYGRIFIGNVQNGPNAATGAWGDVAGIYKVNADGSYSDDGAGRYGTAGYNFSDGSHYDGADNPINMKVKEDDRLYWNNWVGYSEVAASDMLLTTNQIVMPEGGYSGNPYYAPSSASYGGWKTFEVTDILTDHPRFYLADPNFPSGGAWYWPMTNGMVDPNDPNATVGYQAVQTGGDLSLRCDGIAIDANTNVYVIQNRANAGDANMRAACFTNWDGQTPLYSGASWVVGGGDDTFRNEYNMALDSVQNPKYIAVSMSSLTSGGIRILSVTNGATVVSNLSVTATYHSVNWDNVGNLYGGSQSDHRWRVWSPPGTNQATTLALATVQVIVRPQITGITPTGGNVTVRFTASSTDSPSAFTLQAATAVSGPYADLSSATVTQISPGLFQVITPASGPVGFYRIKR